MYSSKKAMNGINTEMPIVTTMLISLSASFPLWAAAKSPTLMPMRMTMTMTAASSRRVQGSFSAKYWVTGTRLAKLVPRFPWRSSRI